MPFPDDFGRVADLSGRVGRWILRLVQRRRR
jgi:hypothetical protein